MPKASLFDRALSALLGKHEAGQDEDRELVAELTDMIVDTVESRVRADRHYREKLAPCVRTTIAYLRALGRQPLEPVTLTRAGWGADPRLNAFFAAPDDIPVLLGRCKELRAFFGDPAHAGAQEAFALLAMLRQEKTVLGPRYEDGILKQDVPQTAVNFTGHRLLGPAATAEETRLDIGRRIMLRLAQVTLGRVLAIDRQGVTQEQKKSYLSTRLRFLKLAQDGMQGIVDDPATIGQQIEDVQRELDQTVKDYIEAKSTLVTLGGYIAQIEEVFAHPEQHVALTQSDLRLNRMNIKVDAQRDEEARTLTLAELRVGDRVDAVIAFVRCPRSELPPPEDRLAEAERFL